MRGLLPIASPIYLAGRYSRRVELLACADRLQGYGLTVRADWLAGKHEHADRASDSREVGQAEWAAIDRADIVAARTVIAFTEEPRSGHSRGGRHVELGMALAWGKRVIVIGPRENVFCWLPEVEHFETWFDFVRAYLRDEAGAA